MKISDRTIKILKNFSEINPSLLVRPGRSISTISTSKKVMAQAAIDEEFTTTFGVYELSRLLSVLSLFDQPDVDVREKTIVIEGDGKVAELVHFDPSSIVAPPEKGLPVDSFGESLKIKLSGAKLAEAMKGAMVLRLPEIKLSAQGGKIRLIGVDTKNPSSHQISVEIGDTDASFSLVLKVEVFKMIPGDYDLDVWVDKKLIRFTGVEGSSAEGLTYFVPAEA